jgi:hypothetical protein
VLVVPAGGPPGAFAGGGECRHQHGSQNGDYCYDNEQLDQRKRMILLVQLVQLLFLSSSIGNRPLPAEQTLIARRINPMP